MLMLTCQHNYGGNRANGMTDACKIPLDLERDRERERVREEMEKGLVSIDRWDGGSQAYFLTHLHADHTNGLSSKWSRGTLFCSSTSARLLVSKFPAFNVSLIKVLEIGISQLVLLHSATSGSDVLLLVTPIDAHHCPGAVMYLFRGDFGFLLHTGDFRWEMMNERAAVARRTLMDALEGHKVDSLYLDNTYCHPSFSFPTREVASQQVIDIINSNPGHQIVIGICTLGKEDLLLHISLALGMKIWVWPERLKTMHLLGFVDNFTTNTSLTRVRAVPRQSLTHETLALLNTLQPTIGILPSGAPWRTTCVEEGDQMTLNCKIQPGNCLHIPPKKINPFIYLVLYSDHSCFHEIHEFVKLVRPLKLTGSVPSSSLYTNPEYYFGHLCGDNLFRDAACREFRSELVENREGGQSDHTLLCQKCFRWKMKTGSRQKSIGWRGPRGRVHAMRRQFGVKIAHYEESDALL